MLQNPVKVVIGGVEAEVLFAGLSGAGLNQLNVRVPVLLPPGDAEVIAEVAGLRTQTGAFLRLGSSVLAPTAIITAAPPSIAAGGSATLQWRTTNGSQVEINPGVGNVAPNGSTTVSPTASTTYTITAIGQGGTASASVTVEVRPAPTVSLTASPRTVMSGQVARLRWTSGNAERVEISPGVGVVGASGFVDVSPTQTTTYTARASGPGGP